MAKQAKTDRQAVIESIRSQQKNEERRRGLMIVGVCAVVALLIIGLAAYRPIKNWWDLRQFRDVAIDKIGAPASVCEKPTTKKATGNQQHVPDGQEIFYQDSPPAFGEHYNTPDPMERKLYTEGDRPGLGILVHNLEHGYTIVWYDETVAGDTEQMSELRGHRRQVRRHRQPPLQVQGRAVARERRQGLPRRPAHRLHPLVDRRRRPGPVGRQAGRRLAVLLGRLGRRAQHLHARLPLHGLPRAQRRVTGGMTGLRALPASVRRAAVVSGYFNPLHVGHLDMMEAARALADALVVIVNNDAQQVLKKGKVITSEADRLRIVEALRVADAALVAVDDDGSVAASLEVIHAAYPGIELVFCNGGDRDPRQDAVPAAEARGVRAPRHRDGLGRRRRDQGRLLLDGSTRPSASEAAAAPEPPISGQCRVETMVRRAANGVTLLDVDRATQSGFDQRAQGGFTMFDTLEVSKVISCRAGRRACWLVFVVVVALLPLRAAPAAFADEVVTAPSVCTLDAGGSVNVSEPVCGTQPVQHRGPFGGQAGNRGCLAALAGAGGRQHLGGSTTCQPATGAR